MKTSRLTRHRGRPVSGCRNRTPVPVAPSRRQHCPDARKQIDQNRKVKKKKQRLPRVLNQHVQCRHGLLAVFAIDSDSENWGIGELRNCPNSWYGKRMYPLTWISCFHIHNYVPSRHLKRIAISPLSIYHQHSFNQCGKAFQ
jgi:hypothetical protein